MGNKIVNCGRRKWSVSKERKGNRYPGRGAVN